MCDERGGRNDSLMTLTADFSGGEKGGAPVCQIPPKKRGQLEECRRDERRRGQGRQLRKDELSRLLKHFMFICDDDSPPPPPTHPTYPCENKDALRLQIPLCSDDS